MIKSKYKKELVDSSKMTNEKEGSKLYKIMAWNYINDILFYNGHLKGKNAILNLATRSISIKRWHVELIKIRKKF